MTKNDNQIDENGTGNNKGSAIFLHCHGTKGYTGGCVAVNREDMEFIMKFLKRDKNPKMNVQREKSLFFAYFCLAKQTQKPQNDRSGNIVREDPRRARRPVRRKLHFCHQYFVAVDHRDRPRAAPPRHRDALF